MQNTKLKKIKESGLNKADLDLEEMQTRMAKIE